MIFVIVVFTITYGHTQKFLEIRMGEVLKVEIGVRVPSVHVPHFGSACDSCVKHQTLHLHSTEKF